MMDWLNDNVIGEIPAKESLTDSAIGVVEVSGVKAEMQKASKVG